MDNKYSNLLCETKKIIDNFEEKENKNGGNFNIFSILDKKNKELSHEAFIYELINPKGSHKQGNLFLNLFLTEVLHLNDVNMDTLKIISEKSIFIDEEYRRLDLYLENYEYIIGIEMKIFSKEREGQLKSYKNYIESNKGSKKGELYYLTLNGDEAESIDISNYKIISFGIEIMNWIDLCINKIIHIGKLSVLLTQYKEVLMELTKVIEEDLKNELVHILLEGNNINYFENLQQAYNRAKGLREVNFWVDLNNNLKSKFNELNFLRDEEDEAFHITLDNIEKRRKQKGGIIGLSYIKENINVQITQRNDEFIILLIVFLNQESVNENFLKNLEKLDFQENDELGRYFCLDNDIYFGDTETHNKILNKITQDILEIILKINF